MAVFHEFAFRYDESKEVILFASPPIAFVMKAENLFDYLAIFQKDEEKKNEEKK